MTEINRQGKPEVKQIAPGIWVSEMDPNLKVTKEMVEKLIKDSVFDTPYGRKWVYDLYGLSEKPKPTSLFSKIAKKFGK